MDDQRYFKERIDAQISYFDTESLKAQHKYKMLRRFEFILAACIPITISFSTMAVITETQLINKFYLDTLFQVIAALAGVTMVIIHKMYELEEYFEKWKNFRLTCEILQRERLMYLTRTEPYDEPNAFPLLVEKIEFILNKEIQKWKQIAVPRQSEGMEKAQVLLNQQKFGTHPPIVAPVTEKK